LEGKREIRREEGAEGDLSKIAHQIDVGSLRRQGGGELEIEVAVIDTICPSRAPKHLNEELRILAFLMILTARRPYLQNNALNLNQYQKQ
jgi:hypothetical protein